MSSFRSLLQTAMGDDEGHERIEEIAQDAENQTAVVDDADDDQNMEMSDGLESEDELFEPSSEEEIDEEEEYQPDSVPNMWGSSNKLRRKRRTGKRGRKAGPKQKLGRKVVATKIPTELAADLGEANLLYASQQYDEAIVILKDFIKKAPTIPDPYHTLGMIYEDRQERSKALEFFLIACTLTPLDGELWKRVGRIAKDENKIDQAFYCFRRACNADKKDVEALNFVIDICREREDHHREAMALRRMAIKATPWDLTLWIQAAEAHHTDNHPERAVDALLICIDKVNEAKSGSSEAPELDEMELMSASDLSKLELNAVNMVSDLLITMKEYQKSIEVINNLSERLKKENQSSQQETGEDILPMDITVKLGICYLYVGEVSTAEACLHQLFDEDVDDYGDLYIDVADAYISLQSHDNKADEILSALLFCEQVPLDQVWSKYALVQSRLGNSKTSLEYYVKAVESARQDETKEVDPEMVLAGMQVARRVGETKKGLGLLEQGLPEVFQPPIRPYFRNSRPQMPKGAPDQEASADEEDSDYVESGDEEEEQAMEALGHDPDLSFEAMDNSIRLKLMIEWGHLKAMDESPEGICIVGVPILITCLQQASKRLFMPGPKAREDQRLRTARDAELAHSVGFQTLRSSYLVDWKDPTQQNTVPGIIQRVARQVVITQALGEAQVYLLTVDVAQALAAVGKHVAAIELLTDMNASSKLSDPALRFEIRFLALVIALEFREHRMAYDCARLNVVEDPTDIACWHLFARVVACTGVYSSHQKFLSKMLQKYPHCYPAIVMAGHQSAAWDIATLTIGELTLAHDKAPDDPLGLLCLGLAYLSVSQSRNVSDRQHSVAKAFAFMQQYERCRMDEVQVDRSGIDQEFRQVECWYNTGRAHQQLGLFHLAIPMYERVLRFYDECAAADKQVPPAYLLSRETAYNLTLIYNKSGAHDLSRYLVDKYLTLDAA